MPYQSPVLLAHEAVERIAEHLERQGWPREGSSLHSSNHEHDVEEAQSYFDEAEGFLKTGHPTAEFCFNIAEERKAIVEFLDQVHSDTDLTHAMSLAQKFAHSEQRTKKLLWEVRNKLLCLTTGRNETNWRLTLDEAAAQLKQASFDGVVIAVGQLGRPAQRPLFDGEIPRTAFDPMAKFDWQADAIEAPWGDLHRNVQYQTGDIDRICRREPHPGLNRVADQPKVRRERKLRHDEKRPEIAKAVAALIDTADWEKSKLKERCRLVDQQLGKAPGWCPDYTLRRALADRDRRAC